MSNAATARAPADSTFELTRDFAAAPERMWKAWTEPDELRRWWGPKGFPPTHCRVDLRRGGVFHYGLAMPDGGVIWGKWVYTEIVPNRRIESVQAFSDEHAGEPTRHPWEPDWPLETHTELDFAPIDGGTRLTVRWTPVNASEREIRRFRDGHGECREGWTGTLDQLEEWLKTSRETA